MDAPSAVRPAAPTSIVPMSYDAMRRAALLAAMIGAFKRWGVYCASVVVVCSAGTNAPFAVAAALAATLVSPLRQAAQSGWMLVPVATGYALVGVLPVVLSRPLWWPRRWSATERALPLPPDVIRRSDRRFALRLMAPWQGVLVVGATGIWLNDAAGDPSVAWKAAGAWGLSAIASLGLSVRWMRHVRASTGHGARRPRDPKGRSPVAHAGARPRAATLGAARALVVAPLLRGRARRTAGTLAAAAVAIAAGTRWTGLPIAWSFALLALVSIAATSALDASTVRELQPLWRTQRALPIDRRACERARIGLVLLPALAAIATSLVALAATPEVHVRTGALVAYCASVAVGCAVEAVTPATMKAHDRAARWVLILAIGIACGSEIATT